MYAVCLDHSSLLCCQAGWVLAGVAFLQVPVNVAGRGLAAGNFNVSINTLLLTSRTPSSSVLSAGGFTVFSLNGRGFDTAQCSRNWVWVGGVQCGVLSCNTRQLRVWFPGWCSARQTQHTAPQLHVAQQQECFSSARFVLHHGLHVSQRTIAHCKPITGSLGNHIACG
eukprot:GHRQ01018999.1.p1 GENE.GHRQ01018999.1~~GHRQ01018999.1.p1  ORF type:complete len:168 (-),score=26.32 GHRQ01018999.1:525-1028(-)